MLDLFPTWQFIQVLYVQLFFFFKRTVNLNLLLLGTNKFPDVEELIKLEVTGLVIEPNGFVSCITKYELLYLPKPLFVAMFL